MIRWEIPLKTVSEANSREHWHKAAKRHTQQQWFVRCLFNSELRVLPERCEITLTRISPRALDSDNLQSSMKFIRDEVAACMFPDKVVEYQGKIRGKLVKNKGHADSDPRVTWKYAQEKGKIQGIRIEICATPVPLPDTGHG